MIKLPEIDARDIIGLLGEVMEPVNWRYHDDVLLLLFFSTG